MSNPLTLSLKQTTVDDISTLSIILEEVIKCFIQEGQGIVVQIPDGERRLVSRHGNAVFVSQSLPTNDIPLGQIIAVDVELSGT